MKYFALLIAITLPLQAFAYDDEEAGREYGRCLIEHQKETHYTNIQSLAFSCQQEQMDFIHYACHDVQDALCGGSLYILAHTAMQLECEHRPGCSTAGYTW